MTLLIWDLGQSVPGSGTSDTFLRTVRVDPDNSEVTLVSPPSRGWVS